MESNPTTRSPSPESLPSSLLSPSALPICPLCVPLALTPWSLFAMNNSDSILRSFDFHGQAPGSMSYFFVYDVSYLYNSPARLKPTASIPELLTPLDPILTRCICKSLKTISGFALKLVLQVLHFQYLQKLGSATPSFPIPTKNDTAVGVPPALPGRLTLFVALAPRRLLSEFPFSNFHFPDWRAA